MCMQQGTIKKWDLSQDEPLPSSAEVNAAIAHIEHELSVSLPEEYKGYLHLVKLQAAWCKEGNDYFLVQYNHSTIKVLMSVLSSPDKVIDLTMLLRESIYDHRTLLSPGLIAIGHDYDDEGDAYLIYDTRADSATYGHVFHWRYYVDNLVIGDGLGRVAPSLTGFLQMPASEDQL